MNIELTPDTVRWEYGSDYHWFPLPEDDDATPYPWGKDARFFGCGRDAICTLVQHGVEQRQWRRLWLPTYFCQDVVRALTRTPITLASYPDHPMQPLDLQRLAFQPGDAVLVMNYFGLRSPFLYLGIDRSRVEIVEDHTHDLWSEWAWSSNADWGIASLRKTLPLPDGGVCWSPRHHALPDEAAVTTFQYMLSFKRFSAMVLKRLYLEGGYTDKGYIRQLFTAAETMTGREKTSGMPEWTQAFLQSCPVQQWRTQRLRNHRTLSTILSARSWVTVMQPDQHSDACPYSGILAFDSEDCLSFVRQSLISERIYPAVLWNLEGSIIPGMRGCDRQLSRRLLSIPCDMRYTEKDVAYVGSRILDLGDAFYRSTSEQRAA